MSSPQLRALMERVDVDDDAKNVAIVLDLEADYASLEGRAVRPRTASEIGAEAGQREPDVVRRALDELLRIGAVREPDPGAYVFEREAWPAEVPDESVVASAGGSKGVDAWIERAAWLPMRVVLDRRLTDGDLRVLAYVAARVFATAEKRFSLAHSEIARHLGLTTSRTTVLKRMNRLVELGYVLREKGERGRPDRWCMPELADVAPRSALEEPSRRTPEVAGKARGVSVGRTGGVRAADKGVSVGPTGGVRAADKGVSVGPTGGVRRTDRSRSDHDPNSRSEDDRRESARMARGEPVAPLPAAPPRARPLRSSSSSSQQKKSIRKPDDPVSVLAAKLPRLVPLLEGRAGTWAQLAQRIVDFEKERAAWHTHTSPPPLDDKTLAAFVVWAEETALRESGRFAGLRIALWTYVEWTRSGESHFKLLDEIRVWGARSLEALEKAAAAKAAAEGR